MNDEMMSRRSALRTVLSLGCGLCLPAAMLGCDSKPPPPTPGAAPPAPAASPASPGASPSAAADTVKKVSQASVQYQTQPKGEQQCAGCMYFIAGSNACARVEGPISSDGWCVLWAKKA